MALLRLASLAVCAALAACTAQPPPADPRAEADGHYLAGTAAYLKGEFDGALKEFNEVKRLRPSDPRLPAAMGEVYLGQRNLHEALAQFQAAVLADPSRATNWSRLGYIQSTLGQRAEAKDALGRALALNPKDFDALDEVGEIQAKEGAIDAGVASLEAAAEAIPDEGKGPMYLRAAELLRQNSRAPESLALLRRADERGVKSGELWVELGDELVSAGEFAPAAETYRKAAAALPKDPTVWELVGELEVRRGRPVEAQEAFRQSLKVHERALPHVALARLLLAAKDKSSAAQELELALKTATGEEKRETLELAELLVSFNRKGDALKLLANLATEPGEATDAALQLRTARLARELGDKAVVKAACQRITDAGVHCP